MNTLIKAKFSFIFGRKEFTMFFVLLGMIIVSAIISPTFRSIDNILNILNQNAIIGVMSIGMAFVLITGAFDLSVSSTVALTGITSTYFFREYGFVAGIVTGLTVGVLMGLANGLLVTKIRINPFVATLGMMTIGRGIVFIVTNGFPVMGVPSKYGVIGMGKVGPIPIAAGIWLIFAAITYLVMRYTKFGQYIYAIGGSETASWLSGINTVKIKILAFVICGVFASLGGIILTLRVLMATADGATGYELTTIASCIVGGISIDGGRGSILSAVVGTLILGLILNMLQLTGVSSFWQSAITGLIILGAVGIDSVSNRKRD
ncbi:MAG: ABC transporter permease [Clostridia bacterium]|nr:ABC transporter permease [Clostridia bacterium]